MSKSMMLGQHNLSAHAGFTVHVTARMSCCKCTLDYTAWGNAVRRRWLT